MGNVVLGPSKLTNPYKFHAYRNAAANSGNGSFTKINYDTELFDTNNNFASGRYTAPVSGFYYFYARSSAATSSQYLLALSKNGSVFNRGGHSLGSGTMGVVYSGMLQLTAADYVEMTDFGSGGSIEVGSGCYFGGFLVSQT